MKKCTFILLALAVSVLTATAQEATYRLLSECDTTISAVLPGPVSLSLGSRNIHRYVYEYPSKDADGKVVTISGAVWVPSNIYDGSVPCDGVVLYNHYTHAEANRQPCIYGEEVCDGLLSSPLKPNYILVISDYIGFGSSADRPQAYLCGDINARNSLDGLVAARRLMADHGISQGKYLFNVGFSQGGTEAMFVAKLRDTEYKDKGITFDKTFCGGGPLDFGRAYAEILKMEKCSLIASVVLMLVSLNENYHLGLDYSEVFQEPLASHIGEWVLSKQYTNNELDAKIGSDSLKHILQPDYLDLDSDATKVILEKLQAITLTKGWRPDPTQHYFIEHSRHDNIVPIQSVRCFFSWMKNWGFVSSIVPGKTTLQTNTVGIKLNHYLSGAVWFVQTAAALQLWPVLYYEDEQNRYYHDAVKDLNLMKAAKTLESWGVDLRSLMQGSGGDGGSMFDLLARISDKLVLVDLTLTDVYEMLDDSGIGFLDLMTVYNYINSAPTEASAQVSEESVEPSLYLLRHYEQSLASWLLLGGLDVKYDTWGW